MKLMKYGLCLGLLSLSTQLPALECEVSYKAKKVVTKRNILRDISIPEYKSGKVNGKGNTIKLCKDNALKPLIKDKWEITHASVKAK